VDDFKERKRGSSWKGVSIRWRSAKRRSATFRAVSPTVSGRRRPNVRCSRCSSDTRIANVRITVEVVEPRPVDMLRELIERFRDDAEALHAEPFFEHAGRLE